MLRIYCFLSPLNPQRTELQSFTARVDRCRSKEVAAAQKEADLVKREEEVRRRELTVNAREDWMQKKEGEFRSAQRVAEHARYQLDFQILTTPQTLYSNGAIAALAGSQFDSSSPVFPLSHGDKQFLVEAFSFVFLSIMSFAICLHLAFLAA